MLITGITYIENFLDQPDTLFRFLIEKVNWDESMSARKTASYGVAYNYSQMSYPHQDFLPELNPLISEIEKLLHFRPNNCLLNYYFDGSSRMGFHSDQTDNLAVDTGVVILSLGATRTLSFRNTNNKDIRHHYPLPTGSLIYMTNQVQDNWQHAILKDDTTKGRISLTFRKIELD